MGGGCRGKWAKASPEEVEAEMKKGTPYCYRFRVPLGRDVVVRDIVRGEVRFNTSAVGDFVILRSNGLPVYNFCVAIDDALMKVTHVLRAEEHLPNTLRQVRIPLRSCRVGRRCRCGGPGCALAGEACTCLALQNPGALPSGENRHKMIWRKSTWVSDASSHVLAPLLVLRWSVLSGGKGSAKEVLKDRVRSAVCGLCSTASRRAACSLLQTHVPDGVLDFLD